MLVRHGSRWFSVRITPADVDGSGGAVVSHVDVTDMHDVQQALAHQALHDGLTGLPNRLLLTDRISQALLDRGRNNGEVAVAFLDLDHFKRVNDSFGHPVGDALLVQVAERLSQRIRATDTLARLSGDEFVVVWRGLNTPDEALALSELLVQALLEPFDLGGPTVNVSASVGLVVASPTDDVEDLLHASDAAMYEAKGHGGNRVRMFTDALREGRDLTLAAEVDLRDALARSELVLHYQPVIDLASGRAVAVEALVRWQHPERGLLAPAQFIPVAEASGLIVPLGRWVLDEACRDAAAAQGPLAGLDVAVNLSVRQLTQSDVVSHVRDALQASGLDPRRLLLEVTESAVVEDAEVATSTLEELSRLGVRVALDDFGTGYSSLLYLRLCPISALKLDRGFVAGIGISADDEAICSSVVSLAHAVGATSIAEGVETLEQYAALREVGCRQAQGFLWSPAVPLVAVPAMLRSLGTVTAGRAPALAISRRGSRTEQLAATARGTRAIAVAAAAEAAAQTAAQTAVAVQRQADASAAKVAAAASRAVVAGPVGGQQRSQRRPDRRTGRGDRGGRGRRERRGDRARRRHRGPRSRRRRRRRRAHGVGPRRGKRASRRRDHDRPADRLDRDRARCGGKTRPGAHRHRAGLPADRGQHPRARGAVGVALGDCRRQRPARVPGGLVHPVAEHQRAGGGYGHRGRLVRGRRAGLDGGCRRLHGPGTGVGQQGQAGLGDRVQVRGHLRARLHRLGPSG